MKIAVRTGKKKINKNTAITAAWGHLQAFILKCLCLSLNLSFYHYMCVCVSECAFNYIGNCCGNSTGKCRWPWAWL